MIAWILAIILGGRGGEELLSSECVGTSQRQSWDLSPDHLRPNATSFHYPTSLSVTLFKSVYRGRWGSVPQAGDRKQNQLVLYSLQCITKQNSLQRLEKISQDGCDPQGELSSPSLRPRHCRWLFPPGPEFPLHGPYSRNYLLSICVPQ